MRLQTKPKFKKGKTEKQKKIDKEKKSKGPKLCSNYTCMKPLKSASTKIDLTKLTYGHINSCDLVEVTMADGTINIDNSWTELLLIMIDALLSNKPDNFQTLLTENKVCNQWFNVDKVYGKYPLDSEIPKVYNIYNSGYYLEAVFSNENIFNAIIGLSKCIGYNLDEIQLGLKNKNYVDLDLNFDLLEEEETVVTPYELAPQLKAGIHMVSMSILGVNARVHRLDVALLILCNWLYDNYGMLKMLDLEACGNTGICLEENTEDDLIYQQIRDSKLSVYTDSNNDDIIKFFKQVLTTFNLDKKQILFKFRALKAKEKLKEYEID